MKNWKVVFSSLLALLCVVLSFTTDWLFIIPAVIIMIINQREIMKK